MSADDFDSSTRVELASCSNSSVLAVDCIEHDTGLPGVCGTEGTTPGREEIGLDVTAVLSPSSTSVGHKSAERAKFSCGGSRVAERRAKTKGEIRKQLQMRMAERDDCRHGSSSPQPPVLVASTPQSFQLSPSSITSVTMPQSLTLLTAETFNGSQKSVTRRMAASIPQKVRSVDTISTDRVSTRRVRYSASGSERKSLFPASSSLTALSSASSLLAASSSPTSHPVSSTPMGSCFISPHPARSPLPSPSTVTSPPGSVGSPERMSLSGTTESSPSAALSPGRGSSSTLSRWIIGDMLWAKVSGHPWWPCMVGLDPTYTMYTKTVNRKKGPIRQYHVQFFGDESERGWISESSVLPYEGHQAFKEFCDRMITSDRRKEKDYSVSSRRLKAWTVAVGYAEEAYPLSRAERVRTYAFIYQDTLPSSTAHPPNLDRKSPSSAGQSSSSHSPSVIDKEAGVDRSSSSHSPSARDHEGGVKRSSSSHSPSARDKEARVNSDTTQHGGHESGTATSSKLCQNEFLTKAGQDSQLIREQVDGVMNDGVALVKRHGLKSEQYVTITSIEREGDSARGWCKTNKVRGIVERDSTWKTTDSSSGKQDDVPPGISPGSSTLLSGGLAERGRSSMGMSDVSSATMRRRTWEGGDISHYTNSPTGMSRSMRVIKVPRRLEEHLEAERKRKRPKSRTPNLINGFLTTEKSTTTQTVLPTDQNSADVSNLILTTKSATVAASETMPNLMDTENDTIKILAEPFRTVNYAVDRRNLKEHRNKKKSLLKEILTDKVTITSTVNSTRKVSALPLKRSRNRFSKIRTNNRSTRNRSYPETANCTELATVDSFSPSVIRTASEMSQRTCESVVYGIIPIHAPCTIIRQPVKQQRVYHRKPVVTSTTDNDTHSELGADFLCTTLSNDMPLAMETAFKQKATDPPAVIKKEKGSSPRVSSNWSELESLLLSPTHSTEYPVEPLFTNALHSCNSVVMNSVEDEIVNPSTDITEHGVVCIPGSTRVSNQNLCAGTVDTDKMTCDVVVFPNFAVTDHQTVSLFKKKGSVRICAMPKMSITDDLTANSSCQNSAVTTTVKSKAACQGSRQTSDVLADCPLSVVVDKKCTRVPSSSGGYIHSVKQFSIIKKKRPYQQQQTPTPILPSVSKPSSGLKACPLATCSSNVLAAEESGCDAHPLETISCKPFCTEIGGSEVYVFENGVSEECQVESVPFVIQSPLKTCPDKDSIATDALDSRKVGSCVSEDDVDSTYEVVDCDHSYVSVSQSVEEHSPQRVLVNNRVRSLNRCGARKRSLDQSMCSVKKIYRRGSLQEIFAHDITANGRPLADEEYDELFAAVLNQTVVDSSDIEMADKDYEALFDAVLSQKDDTVEKNQVSASTSEATVKAHDVDTLLQLSEVLANEPANIGSHCRDNVHYCIMDKLEVINVCTDTVMANELQNVCTSSKITCDIHKDANADSTRNKLPQDIISYNSSDVACIKDDCSEAVKCEPEGSTVDTATGNSTSLLQLVNDKRGLVIDQHRSLSEKQGLVCDVKKKVVLPVDEHICFICEEKAGLSVPGQRREMMASEERCEGEGTKGILIHCEGPCCGYFHLSCLGLIVSPVGSFRCDECSTGAHPCFVCKRTGRDVVQCVVTGCGRFYHVDCIIKFSPLARVNIDGTLTCPRHMCLTCATATIRGHRLKARRGRMYHCVRCPTAYHVGLRCIAAGSMVIVGTHIVCAAHGGHVTMKGEGIIHPQSLVGGGVVRAIKGLGACAHGAQPVHVSADWCFSCSCRIHTDDEEKVVQSLVLRCTTCPVVYHSDCPKLPGSPPILTSPAGDKISPNVITSPTRDAIPSPTVTCPVENTVSPHIVTSLAGDVIAPLVTSPTKVVVVHQIMKTIHNPGTKDNDKLSGAHLTSLPKLSNSGVNKTNSNPGFESIDCLEKTLNLRIDLTAGNGLSEGEKHSAVDLGSITHIGCDVVDTNKVVTEREGDVSDGNLVDREQKLGCGTDVAECWHCKDCSQGKRPTYGEVVWYKASQMYRWWPAEICRPWKVPQSLMSQPHGVGEFPVHLLGTDQYHWTTRGRVFPYHVNDRCSRLPTPKNLVKLYRSGILCAALTLKAYNTTRKVKRIEAMSLDSLIKNRRRTGNDKPPNYKHVKVNFPVGRVDVVKPLISDMMTCSCTAEQPAPCGPYSDCINRHMQYECHPALCPTGDKCLNQRFQRRQDAIVVPYRTEQRGWGLRASEDIVKGQFICEYVGDLVDIKECQRRVTEAHRNNVTDFYMLTLDKNRIIDAGPRGNYSRFMNHSCQPNCETQKWTVNGDIRIGLFALQHIAIGTELTFNYNLDCFGNVKSVCRCGAPICSGFLGVRPKLVASVEGERKTFKTRKRNKIRFIKRQGTLFRPDQLTTKATTTTRESNLCDTIEQQMNVEMFTEGYAQESVSSGAILGNGGVVAESDSNVHVPTTFQSSISTSHVYSSASDNNHNSSMMIQQQPVTKPGLNCMSLPARSFAAGPKRFRSIRPAISVFPTTALTERKEIVEVKRVSRKMGAVSNDNAKGLSSPLLLVTKKRGRPFKLRISPYKLKVNHNAMSHTARDINHNAMSHITHDSFVEAHSDSLDGNCSLSGGACNGQSAAAVLRKSRIKTASASRLTHVSNNTESLHTLVVTGEMRVKRRKMRQIFNNSNGTISATASTSIVCPSIDASKTTPISLEGSATDNLRGQKDYIVNVANGNSDKQEDLVATYDTHEESFRVVSRKNSIDAFVGASNNIAHTTSTRSSPETSLQSLVKPSLAYYPHTITACLSSSSSSAPSYSSSFLHQSPHAAASFTSSLSTELVSPRKKIILLRQSPSTYRGPDNLPNLASDDCRSYEATLNRPAAATESCYSSLTPISCRSVSPISSSLSSSSRVDLPRNTVVTVSEVNHPVSLPDKKISRAILLPPSAL